MDLKTLEEVEYVLGSIEDNYIGEHKEVVNEVMEFVLETITELKKGAI